VGDVVTAIDDKAIGAFLTWQRSSARGPVRPLTFTIKRGDSRTICMERLKLREVKDALECASARRAWGTTLKRRRWTSERPARGPRDRSFGSASRRLVVVDRTLAYIGGIFTGREAA